MQVNTSGRSARYRDSRSTRRDSPNFGDSAIVARSTASHVLSVRRRGRRATATLAVELHDMWSQLLDTATNRMSDEGRTINNNLSTENHSRMIVGIPNDVGFDRNSS
jgi:hypothetical protein